MLPRRAPVDAALKGDKTVLKTSLLAVAAAFVTMTAAPIASHAQDLGTRQIVVDPTGAGAGGGDGSGGGTGGGDRNGTGGGLKKQPEIIAPAGAAPAGAASADAAPAAAVPGAAAADAAAAASGAATATPTDKTKVDAPVAAVGANPAAGKPGSLDAIVGQPAGGATATLDAITSGQPGAGAPADAKPAGAAPAVAAVNPAGPPIKSADGLIGALQTGGFKVDVDHRDQNGDYYLVVTNPKDHSFGYLLTVDDKSGKVLVKEKIDPADYGYYGASPDYGKAKDYGQPTDQSGDSSTDDNSYGGGNSYGGDSGGYGSGSSKY
jgi:hypothetical protein